MQDAVAQQLLDPSAAQFRNVRVSGAFICGEVNGKNRFGAYVGFKPFYGGVNASTGSVIGHIYDVEDEFNRAVYEQPYRVACEGAPNSSLIP